MIDLARALSHAHFLGMAPRAAKPSSARAVAAPTPPKQRPVAGKQASAPSCNPTRFAHLARAAQERAATYPAAEPVISAASSSLDTPDAAARRMAHAAGISTAGIRILPCKVTAGLA